MDLPVGEQRVARGAGRRPRKVENHSRRMQEVRSRASQPLDLKPVSHREDRRLRREGRR